MPVARRRSLNSDAGAQDEFSLDGGDEARFEAQGSFRSP
jgi:hypothetical protein